MKFNFLFLVTIVFFTNVAFANFPTNSIDGHAIGDVITVKSDDEIISWCDFTKQIVTTNKRTICVFNGKSDLKHVTH